MEKENRISKLIENQTVLCDDCGWTTETSTLQSIREWHNKECPECNDCIIINDQELASFEAANRELVKAEELLETMGIDINEMNQDLESLLKSLSPGEEIMRTSMSCTFGREGKENGMHLKTEPVSQEDKDESPWSLGD